MVRAGPGPTNQERSRGRLPLASDGEQPETETPALPCSGGRSHGSRAVPITRSWPSFQGQASARPTRLTLPSWKVCPFDHFPPLLPPLQRLESIISLRPQWVKNKTTSSFVCSLGHPFSTLLLHENCCREFRCTLLFICVPEMLHFCPVHTDFNEVLLCISPWESPLTQDCT